MSESNPSSSSKVGDSSGASKYTIVKNPMQTSSDLSTHFAFTHAPNGQVDSELIARLNELAFVHVLATHPDQLLPPGKSLRAVLTSSRASDILIPKSDMAKKSTEHPDLQEAIGKIAHRAFWDEALEALSSPMPSMQLARLRRLYADLHVALRSLLPPTHPCMVILSSPPSPTSAPLRSAVRHLRELAEALRERCAPVRDASLEEVLAFLSLETQSRPRSVSPSAPSSSSSGSAAVDLPNRVVNAIRTLLSIAEQMRRDLAVFALSGDFVSDETIFRTVRKAAREVERGAILELYGGVGNIKRMWKEWCEAEGNWIQALTKALGVDVPVVCPLPYAPIDYKGESSEGSESRNEVQQQQPTGTTVHILPPQFLFCVPALVRAQNHAQALVIAASLRTLVPRGASAAISQPSSAESDARQSDEHDLSFTSRILALLMLEINEPDMGSDATKLANLADEVVRERRRLFAHTDRPLSSSTPSESTSTPDIDEASIRTAVSALLRADSSAFKFLRTRLLDGISAALISARAQSRSRVSSGPEILRTGGERDRKRLRPDPSLEQEMLRTRLESESFSDEAKHLRMEIGEIRIRGFEDPELVKSIADLALELVNVIGWIAETWEGLLADLDDIDTK